MCRVTQQCPSMRTFEEKGEPAKRHTCFTELLSHNLVAAVVGWRCSVLSGFPQVVTPSYCIRFAFRVNKESVSF